MVNLCVVHKLRQQNNILNDVVNTDDLLQRLLMSKDGADHVACVAGDPEKIR